MGYLISGNAQLIEGIRRAGQAWPVSSVAEAAGYRRPGRRRIRLAHARCIGGRASVAFPRALLARAFRRAVGCELPFSPHAGERHPRAPCINRGFWSARATRFRYCPVSGAASRCARARRMPGLRWRSAACFGRKVHRAKANPTNGAALLSAALWRARMAEARRRRSIPVGRAKPIMIQGTMSNAGKSLLAAGLCRVLSQDGLRVTPFKSQNMALNSRCHGRRARDGARQIMQAERAASRPTCA